MIFKTLILKEIRIAIYDYKFVIPSILLILLIPLSLMLSYKSYELHNQRIINDSNSYIELTKGNVSYELKAMGFRPISVNSIFTIGNVENLPGKVTSSNTGRHNIEKYELNLNLLTSLFGFMDYSYVLNFIVVLIILFTTYNLINGEVENGTLKLILSNDISRSKIILSKIVGNLSISILPLTIGFLIGLIMLIYQSDNKVLTSSFFIVALSIYAFSILLIVVYFNLGLLLSILCKSSIISILALFFIWLISVNIIPYVSPIISQHLIPLQSENSFKQQILTITENNIGQLRNDERELFNDVILRNYTGKANASIIDIINDVNLSDEVLRYDEAVKELNHNSKLRLMAEINNIEDIRNNLKNRQDKLAKFLMCLSPILCNIQIFNEISQNGYSQIGNFTNQANDFQKRVEREVYDRYIFVRYVRSNKDEIIKDDRVKGFIPQQTEPPIFEYEELSFDRIMGNIYVEIFLLVFYAMTFLLLCYLKFARMDIV